MKIIPPYYRINKKSGFLIAAIITICPLGYLNYGYPVQHVLICLGIPHYDHLITILVKQVHRLAHGKLCPHVEDSLANHISLTRFELPDERIAVQ